MMCHTFCDDLIQNLSYWAPDSDSRHDSTCIAIHWHCIPFHEEQFVNTVNIAESCNRNRSRLQCSIKCGTLSGKRMISQLQFIIRIRQRRSRISTMPECNQIFLFININQICNKSWLSGQITKLITPKKSGPEATEDDINAMARISRQAGVIQSYEEAAIRNILALDQKRVHDVMTPRTVVFSLSEDCTVDEAHAIPSFWHFSRIPVYAEDNEDIVGIVLRRDVVLHRDAHEGGMKLGEIMQPVHFVLESLTLDKVLSEFLERHQHLFAVLDEYGGLAGVISLEDVMEELLGREIVDESDVAADLRAVARSRRAKTTASARSEHGEHAEHGDAS